MGVGGQSMVTTLRRVILKKPEDAYRSPERAADEWQRLDYLRKPDWDLAISHHEEFVSILVTAGAEVLYLPPDERTGIDSIYTHDPALVTDRGVVIFQTGKPDRRGEGPAMADALRNWGIPILATLEGEATAEGGDLVWLDSKTLLAGRSFRTNGPGIERLREVLGPLDVEVVPVDLPYWNGPREVLHLMSSISLLDHDLAVVFRRLLPVPLFELLETRGILLVDVPEQEYDSLATNVLALAPRQVVMARGNPVTRERFEAAGCQVSEFDGSEICIPGSGGPTCLTRPVLRG